jgi:hypothetical protein
MAGRVLKVQSGHKDPPELESPGLKVLSGLLVCRGQSGQHLWYRVLLGRKVLQELLAVA